MARWGSPNASAPVGRRACDEPATAGYLDDLPAFDAFQHALQVLLELADGDRRFLHV